MPQSLAYLESLPEAEYEIERMRIFREELENAPPEQRKSMIALQYEIDQRRETMSFEEFMVSLFSDMNENIENMADQFVAIGHQLGLKPTAA